jgi:hypothetical protein
MEKEDDKMRVEDFFSWKKTREDWVLGIGFHPDREGVLCTECKEKWKQSEKAWHRLEIRLAIIGSLGIVTALLSRLL